jgi:hypothetical protein
MSAKGRINASKVDVGTRILVQPGAVYAGDTVIPARTKTGEGVIVTTVIRKDKATNWRGYRIVTNAGIFRAEPIQTMWLAPEDSAGIRRAHVEALETNASN